MVAMIIAQDINLELEMKTYILVGAVVGFLAGLMAYFLGGNFYLWVVGATVAGVVIARSLEKKSG